ncbi:pyrroline-5-carboxylate reductase [Salinadaptatus halalkaliphilus]|uniref:Pyrroline-5-carboxylate reductase n=1 Tax=Salinadaptatus halalkaliphilus TaxID=2419781 RepID=A0A4S3TGF5_9EURY|nr:pyrroline-5-carboxylate reductase [Salinadaptatus halalkaliphilus]THE62922.1 pyrroline-5-carboxylate reductase [Salinadaptatus halalkaliphilus]
MVRASVIGCGNMGSALVRGLSESGTHAVTACDVDPAALETVEDCAETTTDPSVAAEADVVVVAIKPGLVVDVVDDLDLSPDQILVSFAAGVPTSVLEPHTDATLVRAMPNLAAETQNMAAAVTGETIPEEVTTLLGAVGEFVEVEESQMDIATAVNGSGPAFVFYLIGAMRDAGVDAGLEPDDAEVLAAQTFKGAAETVLRSERSIEELIDAVCSPKGTTIEGMEVLWDSTADEAVADAVGAAEQRSAELAADIDDD